jgi:hypothetical protein
MEIAASLLTITVVLSAIFGYALQINCLVKWPIESSLLFVCSALICLLYFSGLLGCLHIAALTLLGVGVLLFLVGVFYQLRSGTIAQRISPGVLFFVLSIIGFWLLTRSEYYSNFVPGDSFSHWGRVSKIIAGNDRLIISTDAVWLQDYPPGMALFDYLFFQFSGFSERLAMFSRGVFIFAAFSQLFSVTSKAFNRYAFFGVSIFIYSLIYFFHTGLHTLSVDLTVGVVFGIVLFGYLADRQNGRQASVIRLAPLVMLLPLIKLIGVLFSFVIISVVVCDILVGSVSGRKKSKLIFAALLLITLCILTYVSWNVHIKNMGIRKTFNTEISVGEIAKAFNPASATERQKTTIDNFTRRVFFPYLESQYKPYYWLAVCLSFLWLIWHMGKDDKFWMRFVPFVVLLGGYCAYLAVLLVLYMFSFGAYEGVRLASYERYVNTYLVGVLIVLFGVSLSQYYKKKRKKMVTIAFITICLLVMHPGLNKALTDVKYAIRGQQDRDIETVAKYWKVIESHTAPTSKIYFIWQNSDGGEMQTFSYGIIPRKNNQGCWSVGEPYYDGDVWTCKMTSSEFAKALMDYDYLFIAHADKKFEDNFLLPLGSGGVQNGSLFQVLKETGYLKIRKIPVAPKPIVEQISKTGVKILEGDRTA